MQVELDFCAQFFHVVAFLMLLIPIGGEGVLAVLGGRAAGWDWTA